MSITRMFRKINPKKRTPRKSGEAVAAANVERDPPSTSPEPSNEPLKKSPSETADGVKGNPLKPGKSR
ncbi:MAG: hypothetical protein GY804_14140 [Alphaproteobacteria bacterium]|nr:hypothetical protein [Alphaproteobacteria bacterium]